MTEKYDVSQPLTIVVFGVTGDLSRKKLLPALMDLFQTGECLPENTRIVGFARKEQTDDEFRSYVRGVLDEKGHNHDSDAIERFVSSIRYCAGDFSQTDAYAHLAEFLYTLDKEQGGCSNKLYYLAVPPSLYGGIFESLASSGLGTPCGHSWVRIAVEKPFGRDLETAKELDATLGRLFHEEQIFRIDHYLAKEAIENILSFRFSNIIFDPIWCRDYVESVHIRFFENFGVGTRGSFYEGVGALRDVGQNHILQMLALIAMEDPGELDASKIRAARETVLGELKILTPEEIEKHTTKGQYASYRTEEKVEPNSKTDTYFKVTTHVENDRWQDVPFILEGGKMLGEQRVEIVLAFKKIESCVCTLPEGSQPRQNKLVISMYPDEKITITFWAKKRGFGMEIEPREFTFDYQSLNQNTRKHDAYEKLLLDCIRGDQTLFTTSREVENAWKFITPILEAWQDREPEIYEDCSCRSIE